MNDYRGQLRRQGNEMTSTPSCERNIVFQQGLKQKYQKSELSYNQSQPTHSLFDMQKSERPITRLPNNQYRQIYDNPIPMRVKSYERQDYNTILSIQILSQNEKGMLTILMHITDEHNPKFLWNFHMPQSDFINLKNEQLLRVDFGGFSEMLIEHLDLCQNQKDVHPQEQTFFHCLFEIKKKGQALLNILQSNKYKQSIHLSLKFRIATDEQVKEYLSNKLTNANYDMELQRNKISRLEQALSIRKNQIEKLQIEYRQEIQARTKLMNSVELQEKKKLNELKETSLNNEEILKKQYEIQKRQMVKDYEQKITTLSRKLEDLQNKHEKFVAANHELQSIQRDLKSKLSISEKQCQSLRAQLEQMRMYNRQIEEKRYSNEKNVTQLKFKVELLHRQLDDKNTIIESNSELKTNISTQISSLEQKAKQYKRQVDKLQNKVGELQSQLSKSQTNNADIREKYEKRREKLMGRNQIIRLQESKIQSLEANWAELKKSQTNLLRINENFQIKLDDKDERIKDIKQKLEESQKKIQDQNTLIAHLQKQLNQKTVGIRPMYSANTYSGNTYSGTGYGINTSYSNTLSHSRQNLGTNDGKVKNNQESNPKGDCKIQPTIKRYTGYQGDRSRSKSPIRSQLSQLKDPQDEDNACTTRIKPVKFKFSQQQN